jgi:[ribosomal protein S18]-alanine N-acetyltransferase
MTIRNYQQGDFEGIMSLWVATGMGRPERGDDAETIERSLAMGGCMFVMTDDESERIIGTSWITYDGRRLLLHHFGILPEYQGRGLSKELLKKSLGFVKQKNIQVKLEVHRNNIIARNLYINAGFEYLGDYDVYIIRDIERI